MSTEKLYENFCDTDLENRSNFADITIERISNYWNSLNNKIKTNILQFNFMEVDDRVFGNYATKTPNSFIFQLLSLNLCVKNDSIRMCPCSSVG